MCPLVHFCMSHLHHYQQKYVSENAHGIKTNEVDTLIANLCVAFCSGGWKTGLTGNPEILTLNLNFKHHLSITYHIR